MVLSAFRVTGFGCTRHPLALPTLEVGDGARLQEQVCLDSCAARGRLLNLPVFQCLHL